MLVGEWRGSLGREEAYKGWVVKAVSTVGQLELSHIVERIYFISMGNPGSQTVMS